MPRPRVLVAHLFHEGHCFNPTLTRAEDFFVFEGAAMLEAARSSSGILGGIARALDAACAEIIPTLSAKTRPGGPVERGFYEDAKDRIVAAAAAEAPDAVCLSLHGAMLVDGLADPEGDLLAALRRTVGNAVPIAAGFDLHAYCSRAMLAAADIVTACKENPHSDLQAAGERAARLALDVLAGRLRPVTAYVHLPFMSRGNSETASGPLRELHDLGRAWLARAPSLVDYSIFNNHSFIDAPSMGQVVLAIADADPATAEAAAADIATRMWAARERFVMTWPDLDAVIDRVMKEPSGRPYVMGDKGDNVLAGAPGDGTALLWLLNERGADLRVALPLTDAAAVNAARAAGIGATVSLEVGGRLTPGMRPYPLTGTVTHLGDGNFINTGLYMRGQPSRLGPCAVVRSGGLSVLLTSEPGLTQDPAAFESNGIAIAEQDLVVAKSFFHFKLSFEGHATPIQADTPGMSRFAPTELPYTHGRPFWPADAITLDRIAPVIFDRSDRGRGLAVRFR
jgi:microcystin degradation protein MlrC